MDTKTTTANSLAEHLRAIAEILNLQELSDTGMLSDEARALIVGQAIPSHPEALIKLAERIEATAPFVPLTEAEKEEVFASIVDDVGDQSRTECARSICEDWSEWQWRCEKDYMDDMEREEGDHA